MAIVKTDVPLTSQRCGEMMEALARRYPAIRTEVLTTTAYGRPVRAMTIGNGERRVLYSAAHHGNEWITGLVLLKFAEELAQALEENGKIWGVSAETIGRLDSICLVPMVDPDGVDLVTGDIEADSGEYADAKAIADRYPDIPFPDGWKANLLGVDLNLQYPAGWLQAREIKFSQGYTSPAPRDYVGRFPLSQREPLALARLTEEWNPALILAYHTQGRVIYWQFRDYQIPGAEALGREFARVSGYALEDTPYESSFAGYKDWFIQNFGRPGYTIECGEGENPIPLSQFDTIYRENLGILTTAALGLPE